MWCNLKNKNICIIYYDIVSVYGVDLVSREESNESPDESELSWPSDYILTTSDPVWVSGPSLLRTILHIFQLTLHITVNISSIHQINFRLFPGRSQQRILIVRWDTYFFTYFNTFPLKCTELFEQPHLPGEWPALTPLQSGLLWWTGIKVILVCTWLLRYMRRVSSVEGWAVSVKGAEPRESK